MTEENILDESDCSVDLAAADAGFDQLVQNDVPAVLTPATVRNFRRVGSRARVIAGAELGVEGEALIEILGSLGLSK